jgi:hypothetical protein
VAGVSFWCPYGVFRDVTEVGVIFGVIAGRDSQVRQEIRTGVMAAEAPDVALWMALEKDPDAAALRLTPTE